MQSTSIPFGTEVHITWLDSLSKQDWIYNNKDLPIPTKIKSIGFVASSDGDGLVITHSISSHPLAVSDPIAIPFGAILELIVVEN